MELRNDIARLEIVSEHSAGAVQLLDKRWRRRTVGIMTGSTADTAQPLLASNFYLQRALAPFADVRLADKGSTAEAVTGFIDQHVPMMILADVGNVTGTVHDKLLAWVDAGGVLVRFAGPRLAASEDDLVPVKLRRGGRILGGALSWEKPQPLASFSHDGPFAGMTVPNDITVTRQVLAEPEAGLADRTWAALADGTPLVTAVKHGKGEIVLFHVTADARWSNLPLSGAFVDMLKRLVAILALSRTRRRRSRRQRANSCRRPASSTASAHSGRRRSMRVLSLRITQAAPRRITRRASTVRRKDCLPSTRSRLPTASSRSMFRRSRARASSLIVSANRPICAGRCSSSRSCCC